jgi:hypothetical protein
VILANHAITGAALASLTPNEPLVGFSVGFLSHFILDAIPHWDYYRNLGSVKKDENNPMNDDIVINKKFVNDILLKVGPDIATGFLISYLVFCLYFKISIIAVLCGSVGGIAPDILHFAYIKWRHEPLKSLLKFHLWIHAPKIKKQAEF